MSSKTKNESKSNGTNTAQGDETSVKMGSINEAGFLRSLDKKGFDIIDCWGELKDDCIDTLNEQFEKAKESKSDLPKRNSYSKRASSAYKLIDSGCGMDLEKLKKFWDIYAKTRTTNVKNHFDIGSGGIGGKCALKILSNTGKCSIHTKTRDGYHLKTDVNWEKIYEEKKYFSAIVGERMTPEEIKDFNEDRIIHDESLHGTTFIIYEKDGNIQKIDDMLRQQFNVDEKKCSVKELERDKRFDQTWGTNDCDMFYSTYEEGGHRKLEKYNPFQKDDNFHADWRENTEITVYEEKDTGETRITYTDKNNDEWFCSGKQRIKKEATNQFHPAKNWLSKGTLTYSLGLAKNSKRFNPDKPLNCTYDTIKGVFYPKHKLVELNDYDRQFFSGDKKRRKEQTKTPIYKNGHCPGFLQIGKGPTSMDGGSTNQIKDGFKIWDIKDQLSYYTPYNPDDNVMDSLFPTQENKKQINFKQTPNKLIYLLEHIKEEFTERMWTKLQNVVRVAKEDAIQLSVSTGEQKDDMSTDEDVDKNMLINDAQLAHGIQTSVNTNGGRPTETDTGGPISNVQTITFTVDDKSDTDSEEDIGEVLDAGDDDVQGEVTNHIVEMSVTDNYIADVELFYNTDLKDKPPLFIHHLRELLNQLGATIDCEVKQ
jgi:hypothetical protein